MKRFLRLLWTGLLLLPIAAVAAPGAAAEAPLDPLISVWQPCEPNTGVTEIVDFQALGNHDVQVRCALGEPKDGVAALEEAGFTVTGTLRYGTSFLCRIDGEPTPSEESCEGTPGSGHYWAYYHGHPGGKWEYSGVGATSWIPKIGSVEGWGFAEHAEPDVPDIRIPAQDSRGATLELPPTSPSSAVQLRHAREWLVRRLESPSAPSGSGSAASTLETATAKMVSYAEAQARSDYPLTGTRFKAVREFLADPTVADAYVLVGDDPAKPLPDRLGAYAIALAALEGGEPVLADGTSLRQLLTEDIEPGTGKVVVGTLGQAPIEARESARYGGAVLEALARTGPLPGRAAALIAMIERTQRPGGEFEEVVQDNLPVLFGLCAAEEAGHAGLATPIAELSTWVAGLQEADGSVRAGPSGETGEDPTFGSTAAGAVILSLGGNEAAATEAAEWLSPYQITAALAGGGPNSTTGGPASPDVGAFTDSIASLREAITNGAGEHTQIVQSTPAAVEALFVAPWLTPVGARVSGGTVVGLGAERATVIGAVEPGTADQSVVVEYGPTIAYGSIAAGPSLAAELEEVPVEVELDSLSPATVYHYRLVARGPLGETIDGPDETLTTEAGSLLTVTAPVNPGPGNGTSIGAGSTPPPRAAASIRVVATNRSVGRGGVVRLATLTCPAGVSCRVTAPARVKVRIDGKTYWAIVLAPRSLAGGKSSTLQVRLAKPAIRALAGRSAPVVVPVTMSNAAGKRELRARVRLTAPAASDRRDR